jgi:uncharacterized protein DUF4105
LKQISLRIFIFISLYLSFFSTFAQNDTCNLRISLLTCSPGEELYSTWGHTAIRVTDSTRGLDMIFNYGTFDDSDPNFYIKFTRGIMIYALSAYPFSDFLIEYQVQRRGIIEQTLHLNCDDKTRIFNALQINNTDSNRFYNYYFHTDNCTTRARDIIVKNIKTPVLFKNIFPERAPTFRQLIHVYLDKNDQYWSKLGIDICLGRNLDKKVTNEEAMFLPDYLMKGFDNSFINNQPLVYQKQTILEIPLQVHSSSLFRPSKIFVALFAIIVVLALLNKHWSQKTLRVFDGLFFLIIGMAGLLMAVLWIIRVDTVCRNNINLLWAWPTHLPIAFVLHKKRNWIRKYFRVSLIVNSLLFITWFFLPQQMNAALIPVVLLIIFRSWHLSKQNKQSV